MAVVVHKRMMFGGSETELKTYQPPGVLSKRERIRADNLDEVLRERIPEIAEELSRESLGATGVVRRWYLLGRKLREIVEDRDLVRSSDIDNMLIWEAIWYHLPESLKPAGSPDYKTFPEKKHKRNDHLSLCYEISKIKWRDVQWVKRWSDCIEILRRPGLYRDNRILRVFGQAISTLQTYPTCDEFRDIIKILREAFPTLQWRDSSLFSEEKIVQTVNEACRQVIPK